MSIFNIEDIKNTVKTSTIENFIKKVICKENEMDKNDNSLDMMGQELQPGDYVAHWSDQSSRWFFFKVKNITKQSIEVNMCALDKGDKIMTFDNGIFRKSNSFIKIDMSLIVFFTRRYNL